MLAKHVSANPTLEIPRRDGDSGQVSDRSEGKAFSEKHTGPPPLPSPQAKPPPCYRRQRSLRYEVYIFTKIPEGEEINNSWLATIHDEVFG